MIVFGILQIILFFKLWGMTNDVEKIKKNLIGGGDKFWSVRRALILGEMEKAKKILTSQMLDDIELLYKNGSIDSVDRLYNNKTGEVENIGKFIEKK
ncbi:MAG: hypothetical protein LBV32_07245 [Tannerellaceae bacterium]|jgi:hypothetical protein|nr:hypothetical protein [Tannerellaceae bacterium]